MNKLAIAFFLASVALGQDVDRIFHLRNATTDRSLQEIVTTVRTVANIQQVAVDNAAATVTVKGTSDQIALAEWLVPKLDVVAGADPGSQTYRVAGNGNDVVVVFQASHVTNYPGLQEIITTFRTVADIQKIYQVSAPKIITFRGNESEIALAEFFLPQMDIEPESRQNAAVREFKIPNGGRSDTAVVYGLAHTSTTTGLQETITNLRTVTSTQKIYQIAAPRLLAFRVSASEVPITEWLISELDRESPNTGVNEMPMPGGKDDVVHVFYLAHVAGAQNINNLLFSIRAATNIKYAYQHSAPAALVLRGTGNQIAMAARMIESSDQAPQ